MAEILLRGHEYSSERRSGRYENVTQTKAFPGLEVKRRRSVHIFDANAESEL